MENSVEYFIYLIKIASLEFKNIIMLKKKNYTQA